LKALGLTAALGASGLALALAAPMASTAQPGNGQAIFEARCKFCHDPAIDRAPNRATLATIPAAQIVEILTNGVMQPMASGMSQADKLAVAAFLTGAQPAPAAAPQPDPSEAHPAPPPAPTARPAAAAVDKMCATNGPIQASASDWNSVGFDANSTRYQPNPGLKATDVPKLKLKWSYAMAGGGMPTVVGDWLFTTSRGKLYAMDAKTGCVHWAVDAGSRTTPMVIKSAISPSGWATFLGERNRTVRAFDAQTGKELWKSEVLDNNPVAGITGTPVVSGDQIFVPLTSGEEPAARNDKYVCCTFRGSLAALDLKTGKKQWQAVVITEPMRTLGKNAAGTEMKGPAGGAIWSSPTADAKRGLVYVTTGDSYTVAETKGADAIVAFDMKTGAIRWSTQVTEKDNYIMGCEAEKKPANCPTPLGPDHDFGASPILATLAGGKQVLMAGQKSGQTYGLDPATGKMLWTRRVGGGGALGGIEWGMASDNKRLYVANSDIVALFDEAAKTSGQVSPAGDQAQAPAKPGLYAINPVSGAVLWSAPAPIAPCKYAGDRSRDYAKGACIRAQSQAPSVIPGVVFSGTTDGWFRAYDAATGKVIWADSTTARTYQTVNGVMNQPGGSLDGLGAAVAGGMVYVMSGFNGAANTGGNGVNVLLAYSVDGK
jgi:polyvinyl alcohol dehydrogenase (cytochrome)